MSSQAAKRKHKTLTIKEKCDILERLNRNESFTSLATAYGVGRSTIYDIKKHHEKIINFVSTTDYEPDKRQTLRKAYHPEVEEALYKWFLLERNKPTPISGSILAMKAKYLYQEIIQKDDFVASKGWLQRFKSRYGIRLLTSTGKRLSNDTISVERLKLKFLQRVKDLDLNPSQVYNADKSGLFWRVLSDKTSASHIDISVPGQKVSDERVTILLCANAAGTHMLKMVVVGNSDKPQSFQNTELPVHYYGQKCACITKDLFKQWFYECFVPDVRKWLKENNLLQKALLLLGNVPRHLSEDELTTDDNCITVMFLPPNCTAQILPMEQQIIQFVKQDYKKSLLQSAVSKDQPIEKTLKEFDMEESVFNLCKSWNAVPQSAISSSWQKLWPDVVAAPRNALQTRITSEESEVIEQIAAETQICSRDLEIWYRGLDKEENIFPKMCNKQIVNEISSPKIIIQAEDKDLTPVAPRVTAQDAINALELGLQWAEENGASSKELLLLRKLREKALLSRLDNTNKN